MIGLVLALAMAAQDSARPLKSAPETVNLRCDGNLRTSEEDRTGLQTGQASNFRTVNSVATIWLELKGDEGRIRLPKGFNTIVFQKVDGWRPLTEIKTSQDFVRAKVSTGITGTSSIEIDRNLGSIVMRGLMSPGFTGVCKLEAPNQRLF